MHERECADRVAADETDAAAAAEGAAASGATVDPRMTEKRVGAHGGDAEPPRTFDRLTRTLFRIPAMTGYFMYTLGPAVVILRDEYGVNRAIASLHGTMSAVGGITAALLAVHVIALIGRRNVLIAATAVSFTGIALLVFGHGIGFSLTGTYLCAVAGSLSINVMTAVITLHHGSRGGAVLTQAHAVLASMGLIAPLLLGLVVSVGWGWRPAFLVIWLLGLFVLLGVWRLPKNAQLDGHGLGGRGKRGKRQPFQHGFWWLYIALIVTASAEHAVLYWAADLINTRLGTSLAVASTSVSAFVGGIFIGRVVAGRLAARVRALTLVTWSVPIAMVGWLLLWLAPVVWVAFVGMALSGLGIACCFPMLVAMMSQRSNGQPDRSIAFTGIGAGIATGLSPFLLAAVSDVVGPVIGFLLVPLYLVIGFVLLLWRRAVERTWSHGV